MKCACCETDYSGLSAVTPFGTVCAPCFGRYARGCERNGSLSVPEDAWAYARRAARLQPRRSIGDAALALQRLDNAIYHLTCPMSGLYGAAFDAALLALQDVEFLLEEMKS